MLLHTMARFTASVGVIILLGFIDISAANKDACELYAAVGQSLTLPFVYEGLANSHVLKWTHNNTLIFYRDQGKVSVGKPQDITATGSLLLKNLAFSSAGTYQTQVLLNGTLVKTWTNRLCVMDKVSKPELSYVCDFKSSAVKLNCYVAKPQGLVYSWTLDGKTLTSETMQTLSISLTQLKGERSFTCSVANKASKESSEVVRPTCKSPPPPPASLLCFPQKTVVAVLAGGAALIFLLLIITMVLCCRHRRNKTHMRRRDKEELRMLSVNKRDPDSTGPVYETMHPNENSPPPSPQPSPKACYQKVSQPEVQSENRLAQLSTTAEGQKPSPVPKPRTKNPQTANM
ncbi:T-cell surface antigen CD2-like [Stegastes partitus]|uniref:T-cell surface antigen CD2-like n=1 Tax=Stegastes partitus TaxID=144197 RepID=A0A9Y4JFH5_9TELE|nr:PREDICTED: T-cell surface antigen CD2-like [Stegastes partitus]